MSMIKALIGMMKWKKRMKKLQSVEPFTNEWWKECEDSLEFLPEAERNGFIQSFVNHMLSF